MADTQRTRAAILALFADNVTGQISAQDLRDFVVTVMESEFVNPGDFWKQPSPANLTTDKTGKGWKIYSQIAGSDLSFLDIVTLNNSGNWVRAYVSESALMPALAITLNSYASNASDVTLLQRGLVYDSSLSARFSGNIGKPVYLTSAFQGSISVTPNTFSEFSVIIGYVERHSDTASSAYLRFDPQWSISGT